MRPSRYPWRILILDGIEKAERNVLPILNNLLENREMALEDGRFLMMADKYDALLKKLGKVDEKFVRSEQFSHPRPISESVLKYPIERAETCKST